MKFPKFNFDDSYPLTLGVADDYFTLSTRLKRIGRAPMQPRRRAAWLLGAALAVSFVAVVPFRLTARAQSEQKAVTLSGVVRDQSGIAVADATVYLSLRNRAEPLETTTSDADGRFAFNSEIGDNRSVLVWADAGARGIGQSYISQESGARLSNPIIAPRAPVKLLLVAPDGTRAANVRLRVGQIGPEIDEQWIVPPAISSRLQTQTNTRGEAVFAALPVGQIAQFWLSDQKFYATTENFGDLRGGQYAPLGAHEAVKVGASNDWKTIRLVAPVTLRGRVTTPSGVGKSGALVLAQPVGFNSSRQFDGATTVAQTRADANGDYEMKGLRPGLALIEVEPEAWLARDYVSFAPMKELSAPVERVDLPLIRGGLVRGVILQKGSGQPLAGQSIAMLDSTRKYQVQQTDAQGRFQFRSLDGWAYLWTQKAKVKIPAKFFNAGLLGFEAAKMEFYEEKAGQFVWDNVSTNATLKILTRSSAGSRSDVVISTPDLVILPIKRGATRDIVIESAIENAVENATLTGQVSLPDSKGKSAIVTVRPAADFDTKNAIEKPTDARGRYSIAGLKPGIYKISAHLDDTTKANWAAPKLTQTLKVGANRADFKLTRGALIEGVVQDASNYHRPIPNIEVLTADKDGDGTIEKTKSNGVFRFRVAPGRVAVRLHQRALPPDLKLVNTELFFDAKEGDKKHIVFDLPRAAKAATPTGTIVGIARDERGQPLAGVNMWAYTQLNHQGVFSTTNLITLKDGKYRFDDFPAGGQVMIIAKRKGYSALPTPNDDAWGRDFRPLAKGQKLTLNVTMRVAPATLAGTVLQADGTLAVNYHVSPQNMKRISATTKANGKFWLAGVFGGPRDVYVYDPMSRQRWGPYRAADNQRDLVLRLSKRMRDKNYILGGANR